MFHHVRVTLARRRGDQQLLTEALELEQAVPVGEASQLRRAVLVDVVSELGLAGAGEGRQHHVLGDHDHFHHHGRVHSGHGRYRVRVDVPVESAYEHDVIFVHYR